ncbi:hypothetical protein [Butyrivibrio proteoclasticus]|uniref:hypothetical protein n=1 Tax=Butyrivibrio proteoclasticus TaxID=43305 RepID=UPI00047BFE37|nr:hypothetical protein [Butyrivibrio proteoclasticus]
MKLVKENNTNKINTINTKMVIYGFIMTILVLLEFFIPYRKGLHNYLLYSIVALRFLLCGFMTFALDKEIDNGKDLRACRNTFEALSMVFLFDFACNFLFQIRFPVSYAKESYKFFLVLSIVEFAISSLAYYFFIPERGKEEKGHKAAIAWALFNIFIVSFFVYEFVRSMGFKNFHLSSFYIFYTIFVLFIREPIKYNLAKNKSKE